MSKSCKTRIRKIYKVEFKPLLALFVCVIFSVSATELSQSNKSEGLDNKRFQFFVFKSGFEKKNNDIGVLFRQYQGNLFYEIEVLNQKKKLRELNLFWNFDPVNSSRGIVWGNTKKIGDAYFNYLVGYGGISTNTSNYVKFYLQTGAGVLYPYTSIGHFNQFVYPVLAGKIGMVSGYGFIDIGLNYSLSKIAFDDWNQWQQFTPTTRIGIGLIF
ncbi:MAG: hypothetical protein K9M07_07670 [Simkaniaceae bacterium]|nr:hypothetical protein [Simkaniaceae bacterium]